MPIRKKKCTRRVPAIICPVVDTGQSACDDAGEAADACTAEGDNTPGYTDNGDGAITDNTPFLSKSQPYV